MGTTYRGGQYILPSDVKPASGGSWKVDIVITPEKRNDLLKNYSGNGKRRLFSYFKDDLLSQLNGNEALCFDVTNVNNPSKFNIEITPCKADFESSNDAADHVAFVVSADFLNGQNGKDVPDGILGVGNSEIICVGVGKNAEQHYLIVQNANFVFVNTPGANQEPAGGGIKVPMW